MRAQRAWVVFRLGRRDEALDQAARAVSALERMRDPNAEYPLAFSRVFLARMLNGIGRPEDAASLGSAAMEWFGRRCPDDPKRAEAACEVGRAQLLEGMTAEGRSTLERCLPTYRAWGQADREVVESLERALADSTRRSR